MIVREDEIVLVIDADDDDEFDSRRWFLSKKTKIENDGSVDLK